MNTLNKVSIIIPAYNESAAIEKVITELLAYSFSFQVEIVVVDDGSSDNTVEIVGRYTDHSPVSLIRHRLNRGYGASLKTGIRTASAPWVVMYDGDGQFQPADVERFWHEAQEQSLDAVIGKRPTLRAGSHLLRAPGKWLIRFLINRLVDVPITDFNCGLRLLRRDIILKYLHLCSDQFSFSTTSTLILINRGYPFAFSPVNIRSRMGGTSSVRISSGLTTLQLILKLVMLFNPLKIFSTAGLLFILGGLLWSSNYIIAGKGLSIGASFLLVLGTLLLFLGLIADQISELRKSQFEQG